MKIKFFKKFNKQNISSFLSIFVLIYGFAVIGRAIYSNYELNNGLDNLGEEVELMREENAVLKNRIAYYQTDVFREREARARLDLKRPGEKVIIIVDPKEEAAEIEEIKRLREEAERTNPEKWLELFFG